MVFMLYLMDNTMRYDKIKLYARHKSVK